jgi:hypothetical protein
MTAWAGGRYGVGFSFCNEDTLLHGFHSCVVQLPSKYSRTQSFHSEIFYKENTTKNFEKKKKREN